MAENKPMPAETLAALEGSISKWQRIVDGAGVDGGTENCPLCWMFNGPPNYNCAGCPVMEKTGREQCRGTPYFDYKNKKTKANAQRELEFLKGLLPKPCKEKSHD